MARQRIAGKRYKLRYKFSGSIDDIEQWLLTNCQGDYDYEFEGIQETDSVFNQLIVMFSFQHSTDREHFKRAIKASEF